MFNIHFTTTPTCVYCHVNLGDRLVCVHTAAISPLDFSDGLIPKARYVGILRDAVDLAYSELDRFREISAEAAGKTKDTQND